MRPHSIICFNKRVRERKTTRELGRHNKNGRKKKEDRETNYCFCEKCLALRGKNMTQIRLDNKKKD